MEQGGSHGGGAPVVAVLGEKGRGMGRRQGERPDPERVGAHRDAQRLIGGGHHAAEDALSAGCGGRGARGGSLGGRRGCRSPPLVHDAHAQRPGPDICSTAAVQGRGAAVEAA